MLTLAPTRIAALVKRAPPGRVAGLLFAGALLGLAFWIFRRSFALPYLLDDFDHVQLICEIRAGLRPWSDLLTVPFHGQTLVLLRLLLFCGTLPGRMSMAWVRMGVLAFHWAGALGCGILCARWTRSRAAGALAAILYAAAAGFVGDVVTWPSSSIFALGATFYIWSVVVLTDRLRPTASLALSVLCLMAAILGMNAEVVAAIALCGYCRLAMPATRFWRRWAPLCYLAAAAAGGILWRLNSRTEKLAALSLSARGFELGAWLIFTAPLRFLYSWTTLPAPDFPGIVRWSAAPWVLLIAALMAMRRGRLAILLAGWMPAVVLAFLVGFARASLSGTNRYGPGVLYLDDRYYYPFLLPLVLHSTVALWSLASLLRQHDESRRLALTLAAVCGLLIAIAGSRQRYLRTIPLDHYQTVDGALEKGRLLDSAIESYARQSGRSRPLILQDGPIPLDGLYRNAASLAFLVYAEFPNGIRGVRFSRQPAIPPRVEAENLIFHRWAAAMGATQPIVSLRDGSLVSLRAGSSIDFRQASFEESLVDGFSWWENSFRWITGDAVLRLHPERGDLTIEAFAPLDRLRRRFPRLTAIHVGVFLDAVPAGEFRIVDAKIRKYVIRRRGAYRIGAAPVLVTLRPDLIWHARDLDPRSLDDRDLSFALLSAGFNGQTAQSTAPQAATAGSQYEPILANR